MHTGACCGNVRVLIDGPARRRDTLVRHLSAVGVGAIAGEGGVLRTVRRMAGADVVQRTLHIECDYPKALEVFAAAKLGGRRTVRYWVGSDVLFVLERAGVRRYARVLDKLTDLNVTVARHLSEELAGIGIRSVAVAPPQDDLEVAEVPRFPEVFSVLSYTREGCDELYRIGEVISIAGRLPEARFVIAGGRRRASPLPNVRFTGRVEGVDDLYSGTSVLLRMVRHDGMPRMVLEALARARPVVYCFRLPGCIYVRNEGEAEAALRGLLGALRPNVEGRRFVEAAFGGRRRALELKRVYGRLLASRGRDVVEEWEDRTSRDGMWTAVR